MTDKKTRVTITPYDSKTFPWQAKAGIHTWVFESIEEAKTAIQGRFGDCVFKIKEAK